MLQITVWARREPTDKGYTAFALEVATKSLPFFEQYFDISDPIPPKIGKLINYKIFNLTKI